MKTKEPGSINTKQISESINSIEFITNQYKRRRISTDDFIKQINDNLTKLSNDRNYEQYLKSIGQR